MTTKPRLGRGLDALIPNGSGLHHETPATMPGSSASVPVERIQPNPFQPRKKFNDDELLQLAESIRAHGVLQALVVRQVGDDYQLIAGERRLRASQLVGLKEVPVHVVAFDDQQTLEAALVENIQRTDLNPIEKAQGFRDYLDRFQMTQEQLAVKIGIDRTSISNLVNLLNLPDEVQNYVREGSLSLGHAKILKGLPDSEKQIALAKAVVQGGLSVHALSQIASVQKEEAASDQDEEAPKPLAASRTAHVQAIEDELRQKLAMRVAIRLKGKEKGQIVLTFDSNDDFERLLDVLRK